MNALATYSAAIPIARQIQAVEAEIAATRARMQARTAESAYSSTDDTAHLEALRAAAATLRLAITRPGAHRK